MTERLPPPAPVRRRRRKAPWILGGLIVLLLLLVAAYVVAEVLIRDYATDRVKTQVSQGLGVERDDVDVAFAGSMVLQAIRGTIGQADVTVDDASFGPLTGDLDIRAQGVPLDSTQPVEQLDITMAVTEENVGKLADYLSGLEVADIALEEPEIVVESEFSLFGVSVPIHLGLEPAAVESGAIGFTPSSIEVAGRRLAADDLRSSEFGALAQPILEQREVCIAEYLPEALTLQEVDVGGEELGARFTGTDVLLSEDELTAVGSCP